MGEGRCKRDYLTRRGVIYSLRYVRGEICRNNRRGSGGIRKRETRKEGHQTERSLASKLMVRGLGSAYALISKCRRENERRTLGVEVGI